MSSTTRVAIVLAFVAGLLISCSTAPSTPGDRDVLLQQATTTMSEMSREDPGLDELTKKGYGYALFPEVAKGGLIFGGGYGRGVVYEQGPHIGYADLSQASFGLQVGGQTCSPGSLATRVRTWSHLCARSGLRAPSRHSLGDGAGAGRAARRSAGQRL